MPASKNLHRSGQLNSSSTRKPALGVLRFLGFDPLAAPIGVQTCTDPRSGRRFGVEFHERYVGKVLKLGFSHISARPRHPAKDDRIVEAFKKTSRAR